MRGLLLSRPTPRRPQSRCREEGFSLLELLVSLALLGALTLLSLPYVSGPGGALGLRSDARFLASRLRAARALALANRINATVGIDLAVPGVSGPGDDGKVRFAAVRRVRVVTGKGQETGPVVYIAFLPDGGSSGGEVVLEASEQHVSMRVDWLTGAVTISEATP